MEGKSLRRLMTEQTVEWRDEIFLENLFTLRDTPIAEGVRRGKWKYIRMYKGLVPYSEKDTKFKNRASDFEQLFDLSRDPEEKNNLIKDMEGKDILNSLRKRCQVYSDDMNKQSQKYRGIHKITDRRGRTVN